jgi:hypothetical protein
MGAKEKVSRYNLVTGEDTYASATSQNPATARKLQSWIPADDGQLTRELLDVKFSATQLSGPVVGLYEFDWNNSGIIVHYYFAAARQNFVSGTLACNFYILVAGVWTPVLIPGTLTPMTFVDVPMAKSIANYLHITDGSSDSNGYAITWVFDGSVWFREGFTIPIWFSAAINLNTVAPPGGITALVGRAYWFSWADQTHNHESDAISTRVGLNAYGVVFTGPLTNQTVDVYPISGLASCSAVSPVVTLSNSSDVPGPQTPGFVFNANGTFVGFGVWINGTQLVDLHGNPCVIIAHTLGVSYTLNANPTVSISNGRPIIAPIRTTHIHIYASETDGSQVGQYLTSIPVTQNLSTNPFVDDVPFISSPASTFLPIFRPVRNDEPPPSKILEVHKYRQWRVRINKSNFFSFSANEEVSSGGNGSPQECWPGTDLSTFSDIVDEYPYPDTSAAIRGMISHADALYIFTEKQGLPLYGESLDDFALSQVTAFVVGLSGRFGGCTSSHGLLFLSYDRMCFLYPTSQYPWEYIPENVNVTDQLIDIGKPQRILFEQIQGTDLDKTWIINYRYGRRDWGVLSFVTGGTTYQTLVYDFNTKGWFHLQQGFASLAQFESNTGARFLVGGGTDGYVYVADDITGTYSSPGPHPNAIWRPALVDFGDPDSKHVVQYLELEFSNPALVGDTRINYYLDPPNVDSPGTPRIVRLQQVSNVGANLYRGWFKGGNTCQRLLLEVNTASSTNTGSIRSVKLVATKVPGVIA